MKRRTRYSYKRKSRNMRRSISRKSKKKTRRRGRKRSSRLHGGFWSPLHPGVSNNSINNQVNHNDYAKALIINADNKFTPTGQDPPIDKVVHAKVFPDVAPESEY